MSKPFLALLPLTLLCGASHADNCDAIASQIEAKMRAGGIAAPQVMAVDRNSPPGGRVVGSCGSGSKQLVLVPGSGAGAFPMAPVAASPAEPTGRPRLRSLPADNIITECKDGRIVRGPDCSRPPPRPKPAASAASGPLAEAGAVPVQAAPAASAP